MAFVQVALSGIGGGLPAHTRRLLGDRGWITDEEYAETFTLASLTPGPNAVNLAAVLGMRLGGTAGAACAVGGILLPGLIVMLAVSALTVGQGAALPGWVQGALRGAACAAVAVMLTAALPVLRVGVNVRGGLVVAALTFLALGVLRLDLLPVLLAAVGVGLLIHRPRAATGAGAAADVPDV